MKKTIVSLLVLLPGGLFVVYGPWGLFLFGLFLFAVALVRMARAEQKRREVLTVPRVHIVTNRKDFDGNYIYNDPTVIARAQELQKQINAVWDREEISKGNKSGRPWVRWCVMGDCEHVLESNEEYKERLKAFERSVSIEYHKTIKKADPRRYYSSVQNQKGCDWEKVCYEDGCYLQN